MLKQPFELTANQHGAELEFKLSNDLNDFTLAECLMTETLNEILKNFDYSSQNVHNSIRYICELFGVNDVNNFKQYENMAKNSRCYFSKLLRDYALNPVTIEGTDNLNVLRTLEDLQTKLWNLKGGRLTCKLIWQKEQDILADCIKNRNENLSNDRMILGVSLYSLEDQYNGKINNNQHDVKLFINMKDNNMKGSLSSSTSAPLSVITGPQILDNNCNIVDDNMGFNVKSTRKIVVNLFYHYGQDKNRINYFIHKVKSINSNIVFNDISNMGLHELDELISNNIPVFILFDKNCETLISSSECQCAKMAQCRCNTVKQFFNRLYMKWLEGSTSFEKFFIFIMEDWNSFKNKQQKFKFAWLLKNRTTTSSKTVRLKPWRVPDVNCDISQNFKYFLVNFNYPNYRVHEFMSSHF